ncbi:MAG: YihY/virulence factor BrkB family protein, partial [Anaerolineae bacterium]
AGMSYYALFSLFPMLLFFIVAATFVLEDEAAYQFVLDLAVTALPVSPQVVIDNLQEVLALRGTIGLIAGLGFLWSASGFFGILSHQVNIIRPRAVARTGVHVRLIGLGIVAGLAILLILWLFISPLLRMVLDRLLPRIEGQVDYTRQAVNILSYWIFPLGISYLLYRYAPRGRAHKREAITGAIVATTAWNAANFFFSWYLSSGLAQYRFVYGSLGSLVAFVFWIYITNTIILIGAHISAAIAQYTQERQDAGQTGESSMSG